MSGCPRIPIVLSSQGILVRIYHFHFQRKGSSVAVFASCSAPFFGPPRLRCTQTSEQLYTSAAVLLPCPLTTAKIPNSTLGVTSAASERQHLLLHHRLWALLPRFSISFDTSLRTALEFSFTHSCVGLDMDNTAENTTCDRLVA